MPHPIRLHGGLSLLVPVCALCAVDLEAARIERMGDRTVLIAEGPRPLDAAAIALASEFGIAVSVEDPPYRFRDDMKDVTAQVSRAPHPERRIFVPKGGRIEVRFAQNAAGGPEDLPGLLRDLVAAANEQLPFAYRIDTAGSGFTLIPSRSRDLLGRSVEITPLLDRRVTISPGTRPILVSAGLMADALSAQTGLKVHCCQGAVAGIPWGLEDVPFEAKNEPARSVLRRLIEAASPGQSARAYWLERCDPQPSGWCFINLRYAHRPGGWSMAPGPVSRPADRLQWFQPVPGKR